jgi:hypothetical protein
MSSVPVQVVLLSILQRTKIPVRIQRVPLAAR